MGDWNGKVGMSDSYGDVVSRYGQGRRNDERQRVTELTRKVVGKFNTLYESCLNKFVHSVW